MPTVFSPRRAVVRSGFPDSQAPVEPNPEITQVVPVQTPRHHTSSPPFPGSVIAAHGGVLAVPFIGPTRIDVSRQASILESGHGHGSVARFSPTPAIEVPAPNWPRVNVVYSVEREKPHAGGSISLRGGVESVDTTPSIRIPAVVSRDVVRPEGGRVIARIGGVEAGGSLIVPSPPPVAMTTSVISIPQAGMVIYAIGGVEAGGSLLVVRAYPVVTENVFRPYDGVAIHAVGGVDTVDVIPPVPSYVFRDERGIHLISRDAITLSGWPQLNRNQWPVISQPQVPFGIDGQAIHRSGLPDSSSLVTPNRAHVFARLWDAPVSRWPNAGVYGRRSPPPGAEPPLTIDSFDIEYEIEDEFNLGDNGTPNRELVFFVDDVKRFQTVDITLDGSAWSYTEATLTLVDPSGNAETYAAVDDGSGLFYYDTLAGELSSAGLWQRYWTLSDGTISMTYQDRPFAVKEVV